MMGNAGFGTIDARRRSDAYAGFQGQAAYLRPPSRRPLPPADCGSGALRVGVRFVGDGNLIIHGDNLHALKALLPRYAGRVDCIYIDPPYNTGNEGWVYNDKVNSPLLKEWFKSQSPG